MSDNLAARKKMRRRKQLQGALSVTTSSLGLAALGSKGGSAVLRRAAASPKMVAHSSNALKAAETMDKATIPLLTTGAGIGGVGGFNFAAIQRAEAKREKVGKRDGKKKGPTTAEKKERRNAAILGGTVFGGGTAALGATQFRNLSRGPDEDVFNGRKFRWDDGGTAYRFSERLKDKATPKQDGWKVKPDPGTPSDPGSPGRPAQPPVYEETLGSSASERARRQWQQAEERLKYFRDHPADHAGNSNLTEQQATEGMRERLRQKYGTTKGRMTDPGRPAEPPRPPRPGRPATPGVPNMTTPSKGAKFAHKFFGSPKRTAAILIGGAAMGAGAAGAGLAYNGTRRLQKERRAERARISELAKGYDMAESAFGVQIAKRSGPEDPYEKYNRAAEKGKGIFNPGTPDPDDWKDMPAQGGAKKEKPYPWPKSGGIDPERRRLKRLERYQGAATAGAVASAATAAGAVAAKPAYKKVQEAAQKTKPGGAYGFAKPKPKVTLRNHAAKKTVEATERVLNKFPKLRKIPTGKTAIGGAAASAALAATAVGVNRHRKGKGRSYTDWWD